MFAVRFNFMLYPFIPCHLLTSSVASTAKNPITTSRWKSQLLARVWRVKSWKFLCRHKPIRVRVNTPKRVIHPDWWRSREVTVGDEVNLRWLQEVVSTRRRNVRKEKMCG